MICKNGSNRKFWKVIRAKYEANYITVDAKNNAEPVGSKEVWDVAKYPLSEKGRFILIISRKGRDNASVAKQIRLLQKLKSVILVASDALMLEMVEIKEKSQKPERVLEQLLDNLLIRC